MITNRRRLTIILLCCMVWISISGCAADEPTLSPDQLTERASQPGFDPVTANADWEPVIELIDGVEMALVPAGCFEMGSTKFSTEEPVHTVCFVEPFWIDVYEVTNEQYGSIGCEDTSWEPDQPRNCVRWKQARNHCEGRGGRLPTEAEWEYAARGPDGLIYPWGDVFVPDKVVYQVNSNGRSVIVGSRPEGVSWVGAYDMSGNIEEWINDPYISNYYQSLPATSINPQGPGAGDIRVVRGGSFPSPLSDMLRASNRAGYQPFEKVSTVGFRCARGYQP
ncbi:MAG: SUMF1/EgtB/PvdO family nonheme iron enzyme [Anaerolineae bacterium]|nr:SUMF1/EgtB/PvdO family nonheme iron enzyme [Anaerolineae bacterium]